jgi:hypothetical protein
VGLVAGLREDRNELMEHCNKVGKTSLAESLTASKLIQRHFPLRAANGGSEVGLVRRGGHYSLPEAVPASVKELGKSYAKK